MPLRGKSIKAVRKFRIGDRVRILPEGPTIFVGVQGVVDEVHRNGRGIAVRDRYDVPFNWGEKKTFFEVQLESTGG